MVIGVDFDGVVNDMLYLWVEKLNILTDKQVLVSELQDANIRLSYPELSDAEFFSPLYDAEFWDTVPLKPAAAETLKRLLEDGHKIYIVTSTLYEILPLALNNCLFKHCPFLNKRNVVILYDKFLFKCDVLLEDAAKNLEQGDFVKVLFNAPYNKENRPATSLCVESWEDFYELVQQLQRISMNCVV